MKVLILSCNTGAGHNSCASAIRYVYESHGDCCHIADALAFVSANLSAFLSWGHDTMYRYVPRLFRLGYGLSEKHPSVVQGRTGIYTLLTTGSNRLYQYISQGRYDTIICTHVFSALMLTDMLKEYPMALKTCFVTTDYTCYPGVHATEMDRYFIPAASLAGDFVTPHISREKIVASGIPIRQMHYRRTDKAVAKAQFGVAQESKHLLMMCGSMGCGPIKELAQLLEERLGADAELSIVCGTNKRLRQVLTGKYAGHPRIHIHGFVRDMSTLMDSADLYLTKPGGLSVSEAAVKNLPMVFIDAVAGCEEHNRRFFVQMGGAKTGDDPNALAYICTMLLKKPEQLEDMAKALAAQEKMNAGECIYSVMSAL